jgi:hypothetical protein
MSGLAVMFGRMAVAVGRFFTSFVFSPLVWIGFALLGVAVALEFVSRAMRTRGMGEAPPSKDGASRSSVGGAPAQVERNRPAPSRSSQAPVDDDMAEIEALLKRRGIN